MSIPTIENYRSISLLNIISKVLERCVLVRLRYHLLTILDRAQHWFILGKSFVTQLVEVIDYIGSLLDSVKQTDVIYLDMSKAFDKVQHSLILGKLRQYNICGNLLSWFTSYLRGRRQRVTCGNINGTWSVIWSSSRLNPWTSAVPVICERTTKGRGNIKSSLFCRWYESSEGNWQPTRFCWSSKWY